MCTIKPIPPDFTVWDKVIIDKGDLTVAEFLKVFPEVHFGCTIHIIFFDIKIDDKSPGSPFWAKIPINKEQREAKTLNENRRISEIFIEQYGEPHPSRRYILLKPTVKGPNGEDVSIPRVQFNFK